MTSLDTWQVLWLADATITRFAMSECVETRKWEQIVEEMHNNDKFSTGILKSDHPDFEVWACWKQHSCLTKVHHVDGDAMCYVYDEKATKWHAWGLSSEVFQCVAG